MKGLLLLMPLLERQETEYFYRRFFIYMYNYTCLHSFFIYMYIYLHSFFICFAVHYTKIVMSYIPCKRLFPFPFSTWPSHSVSWLTLFFLFFPPDLCRRQPGGAQGLQSSHGIFQERERFGMMRILSCVVVMWIT